LGEKIRAQNAKGKNITKHLTENIKLDPKIFKKKVICIERIDR